MVTATDGSYCFVSHRLPAVYANRLFVGGGSRRDLRAFYTALYHAYQDPNVEMDVDRRYRGADQTIHVADGFTNYHIFSLWDTFRAEHPLFTLLEPDRDGDMIR